LKFITDSIETFLDNQQSRLKPNTFEKYNEVMELFKDYLNNSAFLYLDDVDESFYNQEFIENKKEFCDIFDPNKLNPHHFEEFMDYFIIRKVFATKSLLKATGVTLKKFIKWLYEHHCITEVNFQESFDIIKNLKEELPNVDNLSDLIYKFIENSKYVSYTKSRGGYFEVTKIEPEKFWLVDEEGHKVGPVQISNDISTTCKVGWVICLELGKVTNGWVMISSGNVYPQNDF